MTTRVRRIATRVALALVLMTAAACGAAARTYPRQSPFVVRPFRAEVGGAWAGDAIAYGPHRDGQQPNGPSPTRAQLREDLRIMGAHWHLLRIYGAVGLPDTLFDLIRREHFATKVMLGVWIQPEAKRDSTGAVIEDRPEARASNRREIDAAVRLARAYPDVVAAIAVGNETLVSWSANRVPPAMLTGYIREVRARTRVPVTTADDLNWWNVPESRAVAREVDFVTTHLHPLWAGQVLDTALAWTQAHYAQVRAMHPDRAVVIGETGWATGRMTTGEQGTLMKAPAGEDEQKRFCDAAAAWIRREKIPTFFFEAFDENWKGSANPDDAEKHWGFYRADRTPKKVVRDGQ